MAAPRFITPLQFALFAWPAAVRIEELGPPRVLPQAKTGTGSGSLVVNGASFDAHEVRVEIVGGGEPGVATYKAWTDGATFGDVMLTSTVDQALLHSAADEVVNGADIGLRIAFTAGTPTPSFVPGDRWDIVTRPCAAVVAAILAGSADCKKLIAGPRGGGQFTGDITITDVAMLQDIAMISRLPLLEKRGFNPDSTDGRLYIDSAKRARARLIEVANKEAFPAVSESGPKRYGPDVHLGTDRGGIAAAQRRKAGC